MILANGAIGFKSTLQSLCNCHVDHGGGASRIGRRNLRGKEEVFCLKMLTELGLGGVAQVSAAVLQQHSDATRAWQPLLQFEDEALVYLQSIVNTSYIALRFFYIRDWCQRGGSGSTTFQGTNIASNICWTSSTDSTSTTSQCDMFVCLIIEWGASVCEN